MSSAGQVNYFEHFVECSSCNISKGSLCGHSETGLVAFALATCPQFDLSPLKRATCSY